MFTPFFFQPLDDFLIKELIFKKLRLNHGSESYLEKAFDSLFTQMFKEVKSYTSNINEYEYFFSFLYPKFTQKLRETKNEEDRIKLLAKPLSSSDFLKVAGEVKASLFMHLTSLEDMKQEILLQDEA